MLRNILLITLISTLLYSCDSDNKVFHENVSFLANNIEDDTGNNNDTTLTEPDRHWHACDGGYCRVPAHDCMPTIVITANNIEAIETLDNLIADNDVDEFFMTGGGYEDIYPGFYGKAIDDLRDSITTFRKHIVNDSSILYHIVYLNDTTQVPNYYDYYN